MTYDMDRRTDCKAGRSPPGKVSDASRASPPRCRRAPPEPGRPRSGLPDRVSPPTPRSTPRVEYTVRAARITDIEALVALSGDGLGDGSSGPLGPADLLRQLVFLPHATVIVAE